MIYTDMQRSQRFLKLYRFIEDNPAVFLRDYIALTQLIFFLNTELYKLCLKL